VHAVGVGHVIAEEPALGRKAGRALAEQLRCRLQSFGDLAERDGRTVGALAHHLAVTHRERAGVLLHELSRDLERLGAHSDRGAPPRRGAGRPPPPPRRAGGGHTPPHAGGGGGGAPPPPPPPQIIAAEPSGAAPPPPLPPPRAGRTRAGPPPPHPRRIDRH